MDTMEEFKKTLTSERLVLNKIISKGTYYGIIWSGTYDNNPCAVKMVILDSSKQDHKKILKNFNIKRLTPFNKFLHEVNALKNLNDNNLAPKVYDHFTHEKSDVHFGFIVMDLANCSLKDIILKRDIKKHEQVLVERLINDLHTHGFIHGDMKPSNIGIHLNINNEVQSCYFIDCQKVKYARDYSNDDFKKLAKHDWDTYMKHVKRNIKER